MSSQKSSTADLLPKPPKRARGERRVSALLDAAAAVFSEKGLDAATMTEIAQRAQASIGSLYQFFPSKASLAQALLSRYATGLDTGLGEIQASAATATPEQLAGMLVELMRGSREDRTLAAAIIDSHEDGPGKRAALRTRARTRLAAILRAANPALPPEKAGTMAITILYVLKTVPVLAEEEAQTGRPLLAEIREMLRLYLAH